MQVLLILMLAAAGYLVFHVLRKRKIRWQLLSSDLTEDQRATIASRVPLTGRVPPDLRQSLEGKINLFLDQITFVGCDGLEVTDEMRLTIAAQACLLIVNSEAWYDTLRTVLIYPAAFTSKRTERDGYVERERKTARTGESWARGPVVLSWRDAELGARDDRDGENVILHEFAHQLDNLTGYTDGAPPLPPGQSEAVWDRVFIEAHARHLRRVEEGSETVLDPYAATNHQEYFAVAVELFFEHPEALRREEPEVYKQLSTALGLDPAQWDQPR